MRGAAHLAKAFLLLRPSCNALATPAKDAGNGSFAAGRYQEAYDYYSQAILADPESALLRSNRSGALGRPSKQAK